MTTQFHPPTQTFKCQICQKDFPIKGLIISYFDDNKIITCPKCYGYLNTCILCEYNNKCGLKTDTSGEPKIVTQTIRRGMMTVQTQVRNPKLVDKYCISCRCSYGDKGDCIKENNEADCPHYKIPELLLRSN